MRREAAEGQETLAGQLAAPSFLAIIVLYKRSAQDSESYQSLLPVLEQSPELAKHFALLLYDNSPEPQASPAAPPFPLLYRHDPSNEGLAAAYNWALEYAHGQGIDWLLLLDQDTVLTGEYLLELIDTARTVQAEAKIAAIVPKLLVDGKIYSPAAHFTEQVRRQYRRTNHAVQAELVGVAPTCLSAYNSGAALRVSALRKCGGFPAKYWLDYLDHAVFHALTAGGYQTYVLRSQLVHDSSQANLQDVPSWRQKNILYAQVRFVLEVGTWLDRMLYRAWLLRFTRRLWLSHPDRELWRLAFAQVVFLRGEPRGRESESRPGPSR